MVPGTKGEVKPIPLNPIRNNAATTPNFLYLFAILDNMKNTITVNITRKDTTITPY